LLTLSGPTSFAPFIREVIKLVQKEGGFHIAIIICDGQVSSPQETSTAIVEASSYPISIICVGVGDGPWDEMEKYDDTLPARKFDNFQFVNFHKVMTSHTTNPEPAFALSALMEVPDQYKLLRKQNML